MRLILPHDPPGQGARGDSAGFTAALQAQVMETEARLSATLARREMSLAAVSQLAVGSTIPLPRAALDRVELSDLDGRIVARGRLGQVDGRRAVRLASSADSDAQGAGGADEAGLRRLAFAADQTDIGAADPAPSMDEPPMAPDALPGPDPGLDPLPVEIDGLPHGG